MTDPSPHREFEALVDQHGSAAQALLRRLAGNPHDAEDAFQETAIRVWRHISQGTVVARPRSWLMTVAYRTFLDLRDRRRARREPLFDPPDSQPSPEQTAEVRDDARRMLSAVEELNESIRDVIALHYTGGLSLRETADALEISEGTVKSRLNSALIQLRRQLQ